jgi:hypothetical protein
MFRQFHCSHWYWRVLLCVGGCTLGGDIVIDNSASTIISEDVTAAVFSPTVGLSRMMRGRIPSV